MIWKGRSCGETDAESTARKQLGGCRVASSEADKLGCVPDPFTEKSPQDCLVLGSCGKVAHDQNLSVGLLTVCGRCRKPTGGELSATAWAGASPVSFLPNRAPSKAGISPRGSQKGP